MLEHLHPLALSKLSAETGDSQAAEIVLGAINARYRHTSFGLRYLMANLGPLAARARIVETNLQQSAEQIADALLAPSPTIVGLGILAGNENVHAAGRHSKANVMVHKVLDHRQVGSRSKRK